MRDVSPVGSERCLHTAEVTGSSPVRPTKNSFIGSCFFYCLFPVAYKNHSTLMFSVRS